jgi:hypothetical protein
MWEGNVCKDPAHCGEPGLTAPVFDYGHDMNCAIVGGYVYRGKSAPALGGAYIFGDLCTGGVFALEQTPGGWRRAELGYLPIKISSFGEDANGELYVLDVQGGTIYRVVDGSLPPDK